MRSLLMLISAGLIALSLSACADDGASTGKGAKPGDGKVKLPDVSGVFWVTEEAANSLVALDARTGKILARVTNIPTPHNVEATADGKSVWATSGESNLVYMIDAKSLELVNKIATGNHPAHVTHSPDSSLAAVVAAGDGVVQLMLNPYKMAVAGAGDDGGRGKQNIVFLLISSMPVGEFPHGARFSPDGKTLAVANMQSDSVSVIRVPVSKVIDPEEGEINHGTRTVEVGGAPVQVAYAPDQKHLFVTLNKDDEVARINLETMKVDARAKTGKGPIQVFVTPDGKRVLVAVQGTKELPSNSLMIFDADSMKKIASVETGAGTHGVMIEPEGRLAAVTNTFADSVQYVDLKTMQVVVTTEVASEPNGVSFTRTRPEPTGGKELDGVLTIKMPDIDKNSKASEKASNESDHPSHEH